MESKQITSRHGLLTGFEPRTEETQDLLWQFAELFKFLSPV